ncbi:MAG TPA: hypothetical protein VKA02_08115 [Candidatus Acidoferrum sp.]|nr:hypothetical protein [Candidatus Acidoferrum sp.]
MRKLLFASPGRRGAAFLAVWLLNAGIASAQNTPASPSQSAAPRQSASQSQAAAKGNPNDEMLAKASKLYYSTAKAGLDGFDCTVHPDWRQLFMSAQKGAAIAADDPRVQLLNSVKVTLHARMKGGSILDWSAPANPVKPLDEDSTSLLDGMHKATEQTLQGFLQFWIPFVDGSAVPSSSEGLEVTQNEKGYKLHALTEGTEVTEQLDTSLLLQQFNVVMSSATVDFAPAYKYTDKGLLVNGFLAHILPAGAPPEQEQELHVTIEYQAIDGFPIPDKLFMDVVNTGTFNFALDGCTVNKQSK